MKCKTAQISDFNTEMLEVNISSNIIIFINCRRFGEIFRKNRWKVYSFAGSCRPFLDLLFFFFRRAEFLPAFCQALSPFSSLSHNSGRAHVATVKSLFQVWRSFSHGGSTHGWICIGPTFVYTHANHRNSPQKPHARIAFRAFSHAAPPAFCPPRNLRNLPNSDSTLLRVSFPRKWSVNWNNFLLLPSVSLESLLFPIN